MGTQFGPIWGKRAVLPRGLHRSSEQPNHRKDRVRLPSGLAGTRRSGCQSLSSCQCFQAQFLEKGFDWPTLGHEIALDQSAVPRKGDPQQTLAARTVRLVLREQQWWVRENSEEGAGQMEMKVPLRQARCVHELGCS